jgi:NADPH:quinone reductase
MARAVRFDEYGGTDVLHVAEVDEPAAVEGGVVVQVVTAGINPGEIPIRNGDFAAQWPSTFPSGQGTDFAGRVHAIGAGVKGWKVGDEVIGWTDERAAQADFVSVPGEQLTTKPPEVPWEQAGALGVVGFTAYAAVRAVDPQSGETVVVTGAAGGVGSIAVQLLRGRDVRVLGVAGENNAEWLRSIGVEPITYGDGLGHRLREAAPDGIDAMIDTFGGGYVELGIGLGIAPGRIDTIIDFAAAERFGVRTDGNAIGASAGVLAELADMIAAGEVRVPIAATYPLEQVRDAYEELAQRHTRGKIVLQVNAP